MPGVLTAREEDEVVVCCSSANLAERGARRRLLRLVVERLDRERERGVEDMTVGSLYGAGEECLL